ncbi:hypothetical protein FUAX_08580 [Fulvitalea axinellae]|uniref:DUF4178 domain-containing protein n=1 Tax=Fulvitalea axinellae TaxID=1182444 RepID=A0AAU9D6H5_9BACT|nr:hypothetical protein FUAX_08580 [Fulvitalea axinellae]
MGLFDFFKKKEEEPSYDPTNLKLIDLREGFILDYDMQSWEVVKAFEYDWGNDYFTLELRLDNGTDSLHLAVDDNDGMELTLTKDVKVRHLDEDLPEYIVEHETAPKKLVYEGTVYYLDEESAGYCKEITAPDNAWQELINWDYYDKTEKKHLSVTQWGDREFECAVGRVAKEFEFSNIIPGKG